MPKTNLQDIKKRLQEISREAEKTSQKLSKFNVNINPSGLQRTIVELQKFVSLMEKLDARNVTAVTSTVSTRLQVEVAKRKAELAAVLKQYARGTGRFTEEGVRGAVRRLELGVAGDRPRIGGGQYVAGSEQAKAKIEALVNELQLLNRVAGEMEGLKRLDALFESMGNSAQEASAKAKTFDVTDELKEALFPKRGGRGGDADTPFDPTDINSTTEALKKYLDTLKEEQAVLEARKKLTSQDKEQLRGLKEQAANAQTAQIAIQNLSDRGFRNLTERMAAANVSWGNLKRVSEESSTGIQGYTFRVKEAEGFTRELKVTLDQTGRVLQDRQRRFTGFFQGIQRNFIEGLKWTVAIGAIYGPLNKLQEVIQAAIKNEAELARIGTILGKAQSELGGVFRNAANAAELTSESIDGVLEGYTLAFRATGKYTDEVQRNAIATTLLKDSLILSKLSTLDQAQALDTLVGALSQAGKELNQGKELLNSWVAVTKIANVDLKTLAESFAITSTSAENAGISFDELNGIIATVAENTTLSATEAGNAVRAFISGIQTDKAISELNNFGIAVTDLNGETRNFLDIIGDISNLFELGVISDAQLNKISEAIGGGARRGAQVASFIKSYERVGEVAIASSKAIGDADDALARQSDTVESALTRLNNSLVIFGQTLGEEGGVLEGLKAVIDFLDSVVDGLNGLIKTTGSSIPIMTALGVTLSALSKSARVEAFTEGLVGKVGAGLSPIATGFGQLGAFATAGGYKPGDTTAQAITNKLTKSGPLIGGVIATGFLAAMNAGKGNWAAAGGNIGGAIAGFLVSGGNPVGAVIGSLIGETLVKYLQTHPIEPGEFEAFLTADAERKLEEATKNGLQGAIGGATGTDLGKELYEILDDANTLTTAKLRNTLETWGTGLANIFRDTGDKLEAPDLIQSYLEEVDLLINELTILQDKGTISDDDIALLNKLIELRAKIRVEQERITSGVQETVEAETRSNVILERYGDLLKQIRQEELARARDLLNAGKITAKNFREITEKNTDVLASRVFEELSKVWGEGADTFAKVAKATIIASPEDLEYIATLLTEISTLRGEIKDLTAEDLDASSALLDQTVTDLENATNRLYEESVRLRAVPTKDIVKLPEIDLTEFQLVLERAQEIYRTQIANQVAAGIIDGSAEGFSVEETINSAEEFAVELGGYIYENVSGATSEALKDAITQLEEEGKINVEADANQFGIQRIDTTRDQFWAAYNQMAAFIRERFPQYQFNEEDLGAIFRNDVTEVLHVDNLIMQLAMQELIEVNKKQLDGIYNLPSGASFYVPLQAYEMHRETLAASEAIENAIGAAVAPQETDPTTLAINEVIADVTRLLQIREDEPTMLARIDDLISRITQALEQNPDLAIELRDLLPQISTTYGEDIANEIAKFLPDTETDKLEQVKETISTGNAAVSTNLDRLYSAMLAIRDINANGFVLVTNAVNSLKTVQTTGLTPTTIDLSQTPTAHDIPNIDSALDTANESSFMENAIQTTLNFNLNIHSETQLVVDGRTLADVIKDYLYQDMERLESTSTTLSTNIIG